MSLAVIPYILIPSVLDQLFICWPEVSVQALVFEVGLVEGVVVGILSVLSLPT